MWRKIMAVNFAILLVIIALSPYFIIQNRGYPELWDAPIRVMDSNWEPVWYLQPKTGIPNYGCIGVSNNIRSILRTESSDFLSAIYANNVANKYTNTVYLSLTDTRAETTDRVLALLDPPRRVTVEFIEAPAPLHQVEEWRMEMRGLWPILLNRGVQLNSLSLTPNGTILLGISNVSQERIDILERTIEGIVPTGIIVVHEVGGIELSGDVEFGVFEGLLDQEYHPDYPPRDPNGTNVITLNVFDPRDNLNYETYYLTSKEGQFYRYTPRDQRIQDPVWDYTGPKPVKITGLQSSHAGVNGSIEEALMISEIEYSDLGRWFDGVLGWKEVEVGAFEYHDRRHSGRNMTLIFLTLNAESGETFDEVYLASHEGYVYDVPICGTGQPIAVVSRGQSVKIRGLLTMVADSYNNLLPILMVFETT
jgi:hypothetical protein